MEHSFELELPADDEGFVSFACPHCAGRFKLRAAEYEEFAQNPLYCPLCGLSADTSEFLTKDAEQVIEDHATNLANDLVHEMFKRLERQSRGSKGFQFKAGPRPKKKPITQIHEVTDLAVVDLRCCGLAAKVPASDALAVVYCPYCGTEQV